MHAAVVRTASVRAFVVEAALPHAQKSSVSVATEEGTRLAKTELRYDIAGTVRLVVWTQLVVALGQ